jgi:hypothetical protein
VCILTVGGGMHVCLLFAVIDLLLLLLLLFL